MYLWIVDKSTSRKITLLTISDVGKRLFGSCHAVDINSYTYSVEILFDNQNLLMMDGSRASLLVFYDQVYGIDTNDYF